MSVYDKELIIDGKAVRSPEQQVYKNMKDIKELQEVIKPMYKTTTSLTSSSVTVLLANTNVGEATSGWLIDPNGLLFKITGNDETNVLIQYYSDLKGPQGNDGAAVNIDDSITSLTKVWSSQKTNNAINGIIEDNSSLNNNKTYSQVYIGNIINNGLWYSTTQPAGSPLVIDVTNIVVAQRGNAYCENTIQQGDMFFYVDNDLKASELYVIDDITSGVATVTKVCDIGGGDLYTYTLVYTTTPKARLSFVSTNPNMTKADVMNWFRDNTGVNNVYWGLTGNLSGRQIVGGYYDGVDAYNREMIQCYYYDTGNQEFYTTLFLNYDSVTLKKKMNVK